MSNLKPKSREAMMEVSGVGERKMASYGTAFLEKIVTYVTAPEGDQCSHPSDEK